ncbi:MAG: bifunctional indole-3-glycerol-phosphate synthase TrpC/phosphoribosylanthranilate isomerase TrpF [Myxococcota bacterium]
MTNSTPLLRILENKRSEVSRRESDKPLESFKRSLARSNRRFKGGFILECKKASPSEGLIRPDFDIEQIARIYSPFAGAISVLADEKFFQGSLDYLPIVQQAANCPVLCKDFVIAPYQVYEARAYQADMILLMLSVLDDETYRACAKVAHELQMDILTEVHDEQELQRALALDARIIGVNNRDFKTLKVSLDVSKRLLPLIPRDRLAIVESGIASHADIRSFNMEPRPPDGFLIGTSLMKVPRIDLALRDLMFGRVKICGLTSVEDAKDAYDAGAGFGGLIFAPSSPRCIDITPGKQISDAVPLRWIGVFVNAPVAQVVDYAKTLNLYAVQIHGEEPESYLEDLRNQLPHNIEIWRRLTPDSPVGEGTRFVFDTPHPTLRGGTGKTFDWSLIPDTLPKDKIILSGGLNPNNVVQADALDFWALDVNSGVENAPGKKDKEKLKKLFANIMLSTSSR